MAKLSVRQRRNAARRGITCPQPTAKRTWQTLTGARSGYVNPSDGRRKRGPEEARTPADLEAIKAGGKPSTKMVKSSLPESPLARAASMMKSGRVGMQKINFIPPKGRT